MIAEIKNLIQKEGVGVYQEARELEEEFKRVMLTPEKRLPFSSGNGAANKVRKMSFHSYFVLLFRTAVPGVPLEQVRRLCYLDRIYTEYLPSYDRIIDQSDWFNPLQLFLAHLKQFNGLRGLYHFFPPGHPFWSTFRQCYLDTWKAVIKERLHHSHRIYSYPLSEFKMISKGKLALYKVFTLALAHLSENMELVDTLSRSLDQYHLGIYFLDDLQDWRDDFASCNFTYPLTRLILENGLEEAVLRGEKLPLWKIGMLLYRTGIAAEQIQHAEKCFKKATELVKGYDLSLWAHINQKCILQCRFMYKDIKTLTANEYAKDLKQNKGGQAVVSQSGIRTRVMLHPGIAEENLAICKKIVRQYRQVVPCPVSMKIFVGHWDCLPAHFMLRATKGMVIGINLDPRSQPLRSVSHRPLKTEIALAYVSTVRNWLRGPVTTLLESIFVCGVGLKICQEIWPEEAPWESLGMNHLDWQWCQKNEWFLWETVKQEGRYSV